MLFSLLLSLTAVYDYDVGMCIAEVEESTMTCDYREVWPCVVAGVHTRCDWEP